MSVTSKLQGSFNSKLKFNAVFEFTDFEPKEGSKYGGQLVTITGGHFSSNPQDNPIKIGYEYQTGIIHYCKVLESSETEIKCRMSMDSRRQAGEQELIVFAGTYEEAVCKASTCNLTFLDSANLPTVERAESSFDAATGKHLITVFGFDITDTVTTTI